MIAMAHPVPHLAFKREFAWEESRHVDHHPARPRSEDRMTLPSIREVRLEIKVGKTNELTIRRPSQSSTPASQRCTPGPRPWPLLRSWAWVPGP